MKSVRVWNFSGPFFPLFGLNTEIYGVNHRIQSECREIRSTKIPNTDIFHLVELSEKKEDEAQGYKM